MEEISTTRETTGILAVAPNARVKMPSMVITDVLIRKFFMHIFRFSRIMTRERYLNYQCVGIPSILLYNNSFQATF